jgi:CHAT domain-containing protein
MCDEDNPATLAASLRRCRHPRDARGLRVAALLFAMLLPVLPGGAARAVQVPDSPAAGDILTPEHRKELLDRGSKLGAEAGAAFQAKRYKEAVDKLDEVLAILHRIYPDGKGAVFGRLLNNRAVVLSASGDDEGALRTYDEAKAYYEKAEPDGYVKGGGLDWAACLENAGNLRFRRREPHLARGDYEHAVAMRLRWVPEGRSAADDAVLVRMLIGYGRVLQWLGEYEAAAENFRRALSTFEHPRNGDPPANYYRSHMAVFGGPGRGVPLQEYREKLASLLDELATAERESGNFAKSLATSRRSLSMYESLVAESSTRERRTAMATCLNGLGVAYKAMEERTLALEMHERALALFDLDPPDDADPDRLARMADVKTSVGLFFQEQGDYDRALEYLEASRDLKLRLAPPAASPRGHASLIAAEGNLGANFSLARDTNAAIRHFESALAMSERLYTPDLYPVGHPLLARSLHNLGVELLHQNEFPRAIALFERALTMTRKTFPAAQHPHGHPELANSLIGLGVAATRAGDNAGAEAYYREAEAMYRGRFPKASFPDGHPTLASLRNNQAILYASMGRLEQAWAAISEALATQEAFLDTFVATASEAEALRFAAALPQLRNNLLETSFGGFVTDDEIYEHIWRTKAAVSRVVQSRQAAWALDNDPESRARLERYRDVARRLGRYALGLGDLSKAQTDELRELSRTKERLQRELAAQSPAFVRLGERRPAHDELVRRLPPGTAFIDLIRYMGVTRRPGVVGPDGYRSEAHYAAFVLTPGRPVIRVDLGLADAVELALATWRDDVQAQRPDTDSAAALAKLVWSPIEPKVPPGTSTILISPDGQLSRLPWAALPGDGPGRRLLHRFAFALSPHGPALLKGLLDAERASDGEPGPFLAVGDVAYDAEPAKSPGSARPLSRGDRVGSRKGRMRYRSLPGTGGELDDLSKVGLPYPLTTLRGSEASTDRVAAWLPRARWAHLGTHGFFEPGTGAAAGRGGAAEDDDPVQPAWRVPALRNPLLRSGLVLAGANRPAELDALGRPSGDGGVLSAEAISALPLERLELAVLSACGTGLGELAEGEGVFSLQRAFHMAGARRVVASLWPVDDDATRSLMTAFYANLGRGLPVSAALREAQLKVLDGRGDASNPYYWAGWTISGDPEASVQPLTAPPRDAARPSSRRNLATFAALAGISACIAIAGWRIVRRSKIPN